MCNSCDWADDQWSQLRTKNYQGRICNYVLTVILEDSRLCAIKREIVLYLLCVISAIVPINFLVKSGESTNYCRVAQETRDNMNYWQQS
jgi:hypothetical protein